MGMLRCSNPCSLDPVTDPYLPSDYPGPVGVPPPTPSLPHPLVVLTSLCNHFMVLQVTSLVMEQQRQQTADGSSTCSPIPTSVSN